MSSLTVNECFWRVHLVFVVPQEENNIIVKIKSLKIEQIFKEA